MYISSCQLCRGGDFEEVGRWDFRVVICKQCGLVFVNPVDEDSLEKLYRYEDRYGCVEKKGFSVSTPWDYERVHWVHEYCHAGASVQPRLLEIGCSVGNLLSLFKEHGWEVHGIEPGTKAAMFAAQERKLSVKNCFWKEAEVPHDYFDVVLSISTLEHIASPISALERINAALKPGGWLFLEVPNVFHEHGFCIKFTSSGYRPTPQHLYVYSPNTICLLLKKAGLFPVEVSAFREQLKVVARKGIEKGEVNPTYDDCSHVLAVLKQNMRMLLWKRPFHMLMHVIENALMYLLPNFFLHRLRSLKSLQTSHKAVIKSG